MANKFRMHPDFERELEQIIEPEMGRIAAAVQTQAMINAQKSRDTGTIMRSLSWFKEGTGLTAKWVVQASVHYAKFVELGTKAHWPPRAALVRWAKKRGIPVFLVQRAIAKRGTPAQPFLRPALYQVAARLRGGGRGTTT